MMKALFNSVRNSLNYQRNKCIQTNENGKHHYPASNSNQDPEHQHRRMNRQNRNSRDCLNLSIKLNEVNKGAAAGFTS